MNDIHTPENDSTEAPSGSVQAPEVFSDAPTEEDELGRDRHVKALTELIKSADTPMVLALYGTWGAGKTSLMMKLRRMLDPNHDGKQPDRTSEASARTVWFDPWMHQFDRTPALGLLHATTDQLELATQIGVKEALVKIAVALAEEVKVPYVGVKLGRLIKVRNELEESNFRRREEQARLRKHFETVIDAAVEPPKRVVFFIDDLDRCQPRQALAMLEALKLYLDFPGCVYVLGVDRGPLEAAVRAQYAELGLSAESYLDKIVQLPFAIPAIDESAMGKFIEKRVSNKLSSCRKILETAGADDPRQVKRILNSLLFNDHLVDPRLFDPPYDPRILAAVVLLQNLAPEVYRLLRLQPSLIHDLYSDIIPGQQKPPSPDDMETSEEEGTAEVREAVDAAKAGSSHRELWEVHIESKPRLVMALRLIAIPPGLDLRPYLTLTSTVHVESEAKETEQLQKTQVTIDQMQRKVLDLLQKGEFQEAVSVSQRSLEVLKQAARRFPQDPYLRVTRGYIYKNIAVALKTLEKKEEAEKSLAEAEDVFRSITIESPDDPAAWNGLGSVAMARGDFDTALDFIDRALEINPKYEAARQDREMVLRYRQGNK